MYNKYICVNDGRDDMPSTRCYLLPQSLIAFISKLGLQNKQIVTANICSVERVVVGSKSTPPPWTKSLGRDPVFAALGQNQAIFFENWHNPFS